MTPQQNDAFQATEQARFDDQLEMIRRANPDNAVEVDPRNGALFDRDHVLFAEEDVSVDAVQAVFTSRRRDFRGRGRVRGTPIPGLVLYQLPESRALGRRDAKTALQALHADLGKRLVFPEHFLHVSAYDTGRPCPADEPSETGSTKPYPGRTDQVEAGDGVTVAVVDTGRHRPSERHRITSAWLGTDVGGDVERLPAGDLPEYSGHGTFIAGVVRCRAPKAKIHHERFKIKAGGAIRESAMIRQLNQALDKNPHVINLSAGTHTLNQDPLKSFEVLWNTRLKDMKDTVLVAAAGNDNLDDEFYPAAFPWAVGVGSLDRDETVSNFSNYGPWVDVFVVGRNHVNAFPDGHYVCKESPNKGDDRDFSTGLARWSGTSFAAPVVAGILAARAAGRPPNKTITQVKNEFLNGLLPGSDPMKGAFKYFPRPYG